MCAAKKTKTVKATDSAAQTDRQCASNSAPKKAQATKAAMLEAARRIILEDGMEKLSMDRVAEVSGMSKGAVMYHFKTKRALLAALVEEYAQHLEEMLVSHVERYEGENEERFFAGYVDWFKTFEQNNRGWAHVGTSLMGAAYADPDLVAPVHDWYELLFDRVARFPAEVRAKAFLSIMALEGLFYTHKLGLDLLTPSQKEALFGEILSTFPPPGRKSTKNSKT